MYFYAFRKEKEIGSILLMFTTSGGDMYKYMKAKCISNLRL